MCKIGVDLGNSARADKEPDRRQSNHEWTDDQAGRRRLVNTDSDASSLVHAWIAWLDSRHAFGYQSAPSELRGADSERVDWE